MFSNMCADPLYRTSHKSDTKYGKYWQNSYATAPLFVQLIVPWHYVNIAYTEFNTNRSINMENASRNVFVSQVNHDCRTTDIHEMSLLENLCQTSLTVNRYEITGREQTDRRTWSAHNSFLLFRQERVWHNNHKFGKESPQYDDNSFQT
jgi:hypothetical protein